MDDLEPISLIRSLYKQLTGIVTFMPVTRLLCPHCTGRQWVTCEACEGNGFVERKVRISYMDDLGERKIALCATCHGDKVSACPRCGGKGRI